MEADSTSQGSLEFREASVQVPRVAPVDDSRLDNRWRSVAAGSSLRVTFADGEDDRCVLAAAQLCAEGLALPELVGRPRMVARAAARIGVVIPREVSVYDPCDAGIYERNLEAMDQHVRLNRMDVPQRRALAQDPVYVAALRLQRRLTDVVVAGCTRPTAEVIRAALRVVGLSAGAQLISSSFLMLGGTCGPLAYADCAIVPTPTPEQRADIAVRTAATFSALTGETPRIALLSFSTKGSAEHECVDSVRRTVELIEKQNPELLVDGELQFDAAFVPEVARVKAPSSAVAGRANVFVFPDLQSGNIAYKITERIAGLQAVGPVLQGIGAPLIDLSRGCSSTDVFAAALVGCVRAVYARCHDQNHEAVS